MVVFCQRHPMGGGHRLELLVWHSQEGRQDGERQWLFSFIRHRILRLRLLRRRERRTEGKNVRKPQSLNRFMMLKIILLVAIASVYSPCKGCVPRLLSSIISTCPSWDSELSTSPPGPRIRSPSHPRYTQPTLRYRERSTLNMEIIIGSRWFCGFNRNVMI